MDERMVKCREVWKTSYGRILMHARATSELSSYERCKTAIVANKGVSFGVVPLIGAAAYAHIWKTKPTDLTKHKQAMAVALGLAMLTNIWALSSYQRLPGLEDRLIEKYVYPLDDKTLDSYAKGSRFPYAK